MSPTPHHPIHDRTVADLVAVDLVLDLALVKALGYIQEGQHTDAVRTLTTAGDAAQLILDRGARIP